MDENIQYSLINKNILDKKGIFEKNHVFYIRTIKLPFRAHGARATFTQALPLG